MATQSCQEQALPCPDWVLSTGSNVHIAKDRVWFADDYMPVDCKVYSIGGDTPIQVQGIGTISLPVKTSLHSSGSNSHGTLRLVNVLHVPTSLVNIIGSPALDQYNLELLPRNAKTTARFTNHGSKKTIALFTKPVGDLSCLHVIRLSGYPVGPRVGPHQLSSGMRMLVSVNWPESEQEKCFRLRGKSPIPLQEVSADFTDGEKSWLKKHYGDEFKFLNMHGLSICKEEDRQEGRSILRGLRLQDGLRR